MIQLSNAKMKKRGISPLVATVLLVLFVLIIILIVFIWTKKVQEQAVEKDAELNIKKLECGSVQIEVTDGSKINIVNKGDIKINLIIRENFDGNVRKTEVYDYIEPEGSYSLIKSDRACDVSETKGVGGSLCKQTTEVEIIPALKPEGRGAPLVPCSSASKTVKV